MKIGVITFSSSKENYGQLLQCFAMQRFLQNIGHDAYLIRYLPKPVEPARFRISRIFRYIVNFSAYFSFFISLIREKRNKKYVNENANELRHFDWFLRDELKTTEVLSENELMENPPIADAYICGSDQVWGGDFVYYLSFAPDRAKKIAYAPSFGGLTYFSPDYEMKVKELLRRFDFIGVREQGGVSVCHRLGFPKAVKVVDPTLLLTVGDYDKIRINTTVNGKYIFVYLLGNPMACKVSDVFEFAKQKNLDVIYVASQGQNDAFEKVYPQIGEWIDYLAKADFVVTNSFHCSVFSLIYKKKFATIPLVGGFERMNGRIDELLDVVRMKNARYRGSFEQIYNFEFDFSTFESYQTLETLRSQKYLQDVLR